MFVRNGRLNFFVISSVVSTFSSHEDTPEISIRSKVILCHTHNFKPSKSGLCLICDPLEQRVPVSLILPPAEPPPSRIIYPGLKKRLKYLTIPNNSS